MRYGIGSENQRKPSKPDTSIRSGGTLELSIGKMKRDLNHVFPKINAEAHKVNILNSIT